MDSNSSPEQFASFLRQMVTSVQDQVAAAKEDAETSLKLAAEFERKINAIQADAEPLKQAIEVIKQQAQRIAALEKKTAAQSAILLLPALYGFWLSGTTALVTVTSFGVVRERILEHVNSANAHWAELFVRAGEAYDTESARKLLGETGDLLQRSFRYMDELLSAPLRNT